MKTLMISLAAFFVFLAGDSAHAARMPNLVEKTFQISGDAALQLAQLFGFNPSQKAVVPLPLRRNESMCSDPVKRIVPCPTDQKRDFNVLTSVPGMPARMQIEGEWRDIETGTGRKVPRFIFSSPVIVDANMDRSAWSRLLGQLGLPPRAPAGKPGELLKHVELGNNTIPLIVIDVYRDYSGGYAFYFGLDDRPPLLRAARLREYEDCLRRLSPMTAGGC